MNVLRLVSIPGIVSLYAACLGKPSTFVNFVSTNNKYYLTKLDKKCLEMGTEIA
jgi:hypothetical protein